MATREIAKRYTEPELEPELLSIPEGGPREDDNSVEKWRILWENRALLYRSALIGLVASTIIVFLIPARYTTTTRLMPPDQASQGIASMVAALGKASDLSSFGTELLGVKTSGDLFVGVLKSETVQNALVNKFDLRKVYGEKRWEDARKKLENRTDITTDRKSGIITIKVSDHSRERAAAMGREYVEQLNRVMVTLDTSSARRERVFLEGRLKEVQQDLENAEKNFGEFASKNTALDVKEQGRAMIGAAGELEGELIAAETELEGLRQIYTSNNVRVRSLEARIAEYKRQLQKMGGQPGGASGEAAENSGDSSQNSDVVPPIRQLPILGVAWSDLYRKTKVQETVFEILTKQYEMARVEEAREVPSIKVLDVAGIPEKKSFPPRLVLMVLGTLIVSGLATWWVLQRERWLRIDPKDPRKVLAQEIWREVGSGIPDFVRKRFPRRETT
ncbi:MAG: Wzz/FepE/Etk N-terminal domain-containing protein [Candidatus Sulfotelmatobacter sp.]